MRKVNHIIWQPINECQKNCKNCYLKKKKDIQEEVKTDIIDFLYRDKKIECEQFTISLNSFTTVTPLVKQTATAVRSILEHYPGHHINLCITVNDFNDFLRWEREVKSHRFLSSIHILSLSTFPSLGKECEKLKEKCREVFLNYNIVIHEDTTSTKNFELGCRYADMIYLVLEKEPLGYRPDKMVKYWLWEAWKRASQITSSPVVVDQCILAAEESLKSCTTCSAGIDRIHIHSNNMITGCPYDVFGKEKEEKLALSFSDQLEEVLNNRVCHPMFYCRISEVIKNKITE